MADWLIVSKIFVSISIVVGLSLVAEHVSPRAAGILAGYPLGAAISLFFIGVENGKVFAAQGAVYTLGGLSASLVFVYFYFKISSTIRRFELLFSSAAAIAGFLVAAKVLSLLNLNLTNAFFITFCSICFFYSRFKNIPNVLVKKRIRLTLFMLFARAVAAAGIILIVTGIAKWVGPNWSGILSAFPITLFPLILLVHVSYGKDQVHTIIKNFPLGLGALIVYVIIVKFGYPIVGIAWGTVLAFLSATLYLVGFSVVSGRLAKKKSAAQFS